MRIFKGYAEFVMPKGIFGQQREFGIQLFKDSCDGNEKPAGEPAGLAIRIGP
jgi:hypothetical protein